MYQNRKGDESQIDDDEPDVSFMNDSQQPLLQVPDRTPSHHHQHHLQPPPIITLNNSDKSLSDGGTAGAGETRHRILAELAANEYDSSSTTITSLGSSTAQLLQETTSSTPADRTLRSQQRRRSIFDYLNEEDTFNAEHTSFNQLLMSADEQTAASSGSNKQNMRQILSADNVPRLNNNNSNNNSSQQPTTNSRAIVNSSANSTSVTPLVQVSFVSDDKINISVNRREMRNEDLEQGAGASNSNTDTESLTSVNKMHQQSASSTDKRVEFTIGNPKSSSSSRLTRSRPKSVLKRYNIETHSLMSQNVDENEEYEAENNRVDNHLHQQESKFSSVDETTTTTNQTGRTSQLNKLDSTNNSLSPNQHRQQHQRHSLTTNLLSAASSQTKTDQVDESISTARRLSRKDPPNSGSNNENQMLCTQQSDKSTTSKTSETHHGDQQVSDVNNNTGGGSKSSQQPQLQHQSSTTTQYAKQASAAIAAKKKKKNKFSFKISKYDAPCQHNEIFVRLDELVVVDSPGSGSGNHTTNNSLDVTGSSSANAAAASTQPASGSSSMFHFHKPQSHSPFFYQHHHFLYHPQPQHNHHHSHHHHQQHSHHHHSPSYEWREVSRWIKYEQHVDSETSIWSKPFVGALIYQSLLYLKTGLQYGTVLLKCEHDKLPNIIEEMIQDFIDSGHMNKENREMLKKTLLSRHRTSNNNNNNSSSSTANNPGSMRKKSTLSEFFPYGSRRQSTFTSAGDHQSQNSQKNMSSENASVMDVSRKSSGIQLNDLAVAFGVGNKNKKMMSRSDANLLNKNGNGSNSQSISNAPHRENSVKFFEPSQEGASLANCSSFENNLQQPSTFQYKRRRSTLALLKSTLGQSKLNKSDLSIKGLSIDAESLIIFVGTVDYLDRPVMSFVRLSNSQVIDDLGDVKVKFLFVLIGPRNENIDYLEIGRCMGTLMTNKEFHDCVYRANDRRELIEGITSFINRSLCVVVPAGEFDNDLMLPILEWARSKMKNKREKQMQQSLTSGGPSGAPGTISDKLLSASTSSGGLMSLSPTSPLASKGRHRSVLGGSMINDKLMGYGRAVSELYYNRSNSTNKNQEQSSSGLTATPGTPSVTGAGGAASGNQMPDTNFLFESELVYNHEYDPFQKTGRLFGNLLRELKYRYSLYWSDFVDGLNIHCFIAFIFIFTICIATSLSFGGILADKTNKWFGVNEMLIATSMNGVIFGLFSAQPLMILGSTGPFLVFEEMLYMLCKKLCLDFLVVRCWVAMWVFLFSLIMVAFEAVYVIRYVTRFTEEIFAFLIASVFLTDAVKKIIQVFNEDPIQKVEEYCKNNYTSPAVLLGASRPAWVNNETGYSRINEATDCVLYQMEMNLTQAEHTHQPRPNIALLSLILLIGTCCIALSLKKLRRSSFLGARARRTLSDVGVLISIILMTLVDSLIKAHTGVETPKLDIPNSTMTPTKYRNEWFVTPFAFTPSQFWVPLLAMVPAALVFIVLFFEIELTGMILNTKHRQLKKGSGFHLDLLLSASLMNVNSLFGLPWTCAAPVRTLAHWASLTVFSKTYVPGEKARLIDVKEQRLTNICVHLAIAVCLLAKSALKMIPISVLFGVFLYFGLVSLSGTQLYERIKLIFVPHKYCPSAVYARGVRPSKRNLFTFIQVFFIFSLLLIKSFNQISYVFSIILVFLVPLRIFIMPKIFTKKELEQLDNQDELIDDTDSTLDFYEVAHMPI